MSTLPPTLDWKPRHNPWLVAFTVTLATFMEVLDTSIANVALPHMAGSLGASSNEATWVLTSYLIASAVVLPISGWMQNRFGRKRFYMACVVVFTLSSLLCGLATTLPLLIFTRILQGLGGGGLAPSEQAILADTFPVAKRGQAFAVYGMAVVAAPAIGPTLGGWITDNYNWHWIFFINLPIGILSLYLSNRMVEDPPYLVSRRAEAIGQRVDFVGLVTVAAGVGSLAFVLDKGQEKDWFGSGLIVSFAVAAVAFLAFFAVWEWRHRNPIVDLRLLRIRNFGISVGLQFMLGMVLFGSTVLLPQFMQGLLGYTAERAGMALSPAGFALMCTMPLVGQIVGRVRDPRKLVAFGYAITAVGLYNLTRLDLDVSFGTLALWRMFQVLGLACVFVPISTLNYVGVPREKNNQISSLSNFARNLGGSFGTALLTTFLERTAQAHQQALGSIAVAGSGAYAGWIAQMQSALEKMGHAGARQLAEGQAYQELLRQASMLSYQNAFWLLAVAVAALVPVPFLMQRPPARPSAAQGLEKPTRTSPAARAGR